MSLLASAARLESDELIVRNDIDIPGSAPNVSLLLARPNPGGSGHGSPDGLVRLFNCTLETNSQSRGRVDPFTMRLSHKLILRSPFSHPFTCLRSAHTTAMRTLRTCVTIGSQAQTTAHPAPRFPHPFRPDLGSNTARRLIITMFPEVHDGTG